VDVAASDCWKSHRAHIGRWYLIRAMKQIEKWNQNISDIFIVRELLTALALVIALTVTYALWNSANHLAELAQRTAFDFRTRESNQRIRQRISIYEQALRATAGFFNASKTVNREDFHTFIDAFDLMENFPGIQGIGFVILVSAAEKDKHVMSVRAQGFPEYTIKPEGRRDMYTSVLYLEPFSESNRRAFGYDMYSEPTRRAAMAQARDSGKPAVSAKVFLVQDAGSEAQPGFLMFLPVYRNGAPHDTVDHRRMSLVGWVYAPFRMNDFMHGLHGERAGDLDIELYDNNTLSEQSRIYDADSAVSATDPSHTLRHVDRIEAGNRTWTIITTPLPDYQENMKSDRPLLVLQAGISISLMVALLIWLFLDDRARALQVTHQAMQLALYDVLTGLPNRKLIDERLEQALAMARRSHMHIALLFIDLDKFKAVNDNFGHAYGDLLLKEVAKRLRSCMRESDTACRLGGDEFVALLPDIEGKNAVQVVATKILNQLTQPFHIAGHTFDISASIGAAIYPDDGSDAKTLMKNADFAMYAAKKSGRGNVKFVHQETDGKLRS
jgi:diguanylate cyclase